MKALTSLSELNATLDVAAVAQFLAVRYVPAPRTHLQGVSKLMAGIAQILALAILFVAYLNRATNEVMFPLIFTAIFCELLTIALLIMDRQR